MCRTDGRRVGVQLTGRREPLNFSRAGLALCFGLAVPGPTPLAPLAPEPLFGPASTVVILSGLPGDLEHERTYEAHVNRLLEVLAAPEARPRRVVLLADSLTRISPPAVLSLQTSAASRDAFLALGRQMASEAGPLVLLAWGHGGVQGATPVFHVRGPRITADDFAAFVASVGRRPVRCVLAFRGSGHFARALRAEGREIVSSENEVAFRDDPVAVELLLPILRERAGTDLAAVADRLGRAVGDWYAGQGLARTEEPTLWRAVADPIPLVPPSAPGLAVAERSADRAPAAEAPAIVPDPPSPDRPAAAWQDIRAVDPAAHAGAPAIVLRRMETYTLGQNPALTHEVDQYVQVLTADGLSQGDVDVVYSPPEERLTFLDCEVRSPDGRIERLEADGIRDAGPPSLPPGYRGPSRKLFSLPGVKPGAILRVHYRRQWARFPLPHALLDVPLAGAVPTLGATVEVRVPTGSAFHWSFRDAPRREPVAVPSTYGTSYLWKLDAAPAAQAEDLSPPDAGPRLLVSTFPDWPAFSAWYRRLILHADEITPEIEAEARRLASGLRSDLEKVRAVYHSVTRMRYVAVPLGVNSHRPHAAAHVLRNGYGDCKDKANLFNTLLRALGITADLVLVPRFTQAEEGLPGHAFNHAISRVRMGGQTLWVDTTDENCRLGLLPPGDPGRKVLVVDGEASRLDQLPVPEPGAHRLAITAAVQVDAAGQARGGLSLEASGYADYALRAAARDTAGVGTRPVLAQDYRPAGGVFSMASQAHSGATALEDDFRWRAEGSWSGLVSTLPEGRRLVRAPFWLPREWDAALHPRRSPLFLNQGYPLTLVQQISIGLPAGAGRVALPPRRARGTGPLRYRLEWKAGATVLEASLRVELTVAEIDAPGTAEFQAALSELLRAVAEGSTYEATT